MAWLKRLNPFNDLNAETAESWNNPDVEEWMETSKTLLKGYFCEFRGSQFVSYSLPGSRRALKFRILYALYGPPEENETTTTPSNDYSDYPSDCDVGYHIEYNQGTFEEFYDAELDAESSEASIDPILLEDDSFPTEFDAYNDEKNNVAEFLIKIIENLTTEQQAAKAPVYIGIIFISCKQENVGEYTCPIFSLLKPHQIVDSPRAQRYFIDRDGRVYESWQHWKTNNTMPMLKYAYPKFGYYTTDQDGEYEFNPNKDLAIDFGNSPQCSTQSKLFQTAENVSSIGGFACSIVFGASMLTPVGPAALMTAGGFGAIFAAYGGARSVRRIYDKIEHREDFKNLESAILICSVVAMPLSLIGSSANMALVRNAQMESSFFASSNFKTFVTLLNLTNCSFEGAFVCMNVANLYEKYQKDGLTPLDVLHFSMSVFFFTNTLIRPMVANSIIAESHNRNIDSYKTSMSDERAQEIMQTKYLDKNQDSAKVVRNLQNIKNHEQFFASIPDDVKKIKVTGKNNQNVLLIKTNGKVQRINPRTFRSNQPTVSSMSELSGFQNFQLNQITSEYTCGVILAGSSYLFKWAQGNNPIIEICQRLFKHFGVDPRIREILLDIVRLVVKECQKRNSTNVTAGAQSLLDNIDTFTVTLARDVQTAKSIADSWGLKFENDFKAYLLYKKYGREFPAKLQNQNIQVFIEYSPDVLSDTITMKELEKVANFTNGVQRKVTVTMLGEVTVSLKNFVTDQTYQCNGNPLDSRRKIREYVQHSGVKEILQVLPRQVFDILGVSSSNPSFYQGVSVTLFLEGSTHGVEYSNLN